MAITIQPFRVIAGSGMCAGGYSAHAGQSDLLRFVTGIPQMPAEIRIVHGDDEAKAALKRKPEEAAASHVEIPGGARG